MPAWTIIYCGLRVPGQNDVFVRSFTQGLTFPDSCVELYIGGRLMFDVSAWRCCNGGNDHLGNWLLPHWPTSLEMMLKKSDMDSSDISSDIIRLISKKWLTCHSGELIQLISLCLHDFSRWFHWSSMRRKPLLYLWTRRLTEPPEIGLKTLPARPASRGMVFLWGWFESSNALCNANVQSSIYTVIILHIY